MDISGLPGVLLKVNIVDVDQYIIPLMINFIIIGILAKFEFDGGNQNGNFRNKCGVEAVFVRHDYGTVLTKGAEGFDDALFYMEK